MKRRLALLAALLLGASAARALSVGVNAQPGTVNAGQLLTVAVQVDNPGASQMNNVSSSVQIYGSASAALSYAPAPFSASVAPAGSAVFTWVFSASGCGSLSFSAAASAYDSGSGLTVTAGPAASNAVTVTCYTPTPSPVVTATPTTTPTASPTPWIVAATATPPPLFGDASIPGNLFHPDRGQPLSLNFSVPLEGTVQIDLYNRVGARVRHFEQNVLPGSHSQLWDGRDEQGAPVASGIYVAQFKGKGLFKAVKLAVVK